MRIWQVIESDTQMRFFWFATKREALAHKRNYEPPFDGATCEIEPVKFAGGRAGMASALNWVMEMTCFNEG